jgi:hypothetical protein
MGMKSIIKKLLREGLFDDIPEELFVKAYKAKINELYDNLIMKGEKNSEFYFILGKNMVYNSIGAKNKCETNVFEFIKNSLKSGVEKYYPVGGFAFEGKSLFPIEHWWVYDSDAKKFIEITPMEGPEPPRCYAGIVNKNIQEEILNARYFYDVDFFKGGNVQKFYFK